MGYSFDMRGRLCCDNCGNGGGVRKRTCPYRVTWHDGHSVAYCYAPALCSPCYSHLGGLRGVHGQRCRVGAAESQAREDRIKAKLAAGDVKVNAAWGGWHEDVPPGQVMVQCSDGKRYFIAENEYANRTIDNFLSEFPSARECTYQKGK